MDGTIIQQGRFTSDGTAVDLNIRSDVDWIEVINETQWATTQTPGRGIKFEWQRGLSDGHAFEYTKADGANTLQAEKVTSGGFDLLPIVASSLITGTTITKAAPPVCTATAHGFSNEDLVVLTSLTNMTQLGVILFTIGSVTTNTFELSFFDTNTANFTAETSFQVRSLPEFDYSDSVNWISSITTGTTTQVQLTANAPHLSYTVGKIIRFTIPEAYGMSQMNGLSGEILSINTTTNTYTVDINSSSFDAFAYPANSAIPSSVPIVTSIGNVSNSSEDALTNLDFIGIKLSAGIDGPAGSSGDVVYWKTGKSFSITNE